MSGHKSAGYYDTKSYFMKHLNTGSLNRQLKTRQKHSHRLQVRTLLKLKKNVLIRLFIIISNAFFFRHGSHFGRLAKEKNTHASKRCTAMFEPFFASLDKFLPIF